MLNQIGRLHKKRKNNEDIQQVVVVIYIVYGLKEIEQNIYFYTVGV